MKKLAFLFLFACLAACEQSADENTNTENPNEEIEVVPDISGEYVGDFGGDGPIRLDILVKERGFAEGESHHRDEHRPLSGSYLLDSGIYRITLHEPGDRPYDGVFQLALPEGDSVIYGTWSPMKAKDIGQVELSLMRNRQ